MKKLLKPTIFIAIAITLFAIFININTEQSTPTIPSPYSKTILNENEFIVSTSCDPEVVKAYKREWRNAPDSLKKYVENIYITDENLNARFDFNQDLKILAVSYGNEIYIHGFTFNKDVLIHELFHVYDYSHGWISNKQEFINIYSQEKDTIKDCTNSYEFFATAGALYYKDPDALMKNSPQTYNYFKKTVSFE